MFSGGANLSAIPSRPSTLHHVSPRPHLRPSVIQRTDRQTDRHRHEEQPSRTTAQPSLPPPVFSLDARLRRGTARGVGVDVVVGVGVGVMPGASHHRRRQRASRPSVASSRQASIKPGADERVDPPPGIGLLISRPADKNGERDLRGSRALFRPVRLISLKPPGGKRKSERARGREKERERKREGKMERAAGSIAIRTDG